MSEQVENFRAMDEYNRQKKAANREIRSPMIEELRAAGYRVRKITEYQYRVNERLDLFPSNARWHDIKSGARGGWGQETGLMIVKRVLG